MEKVGSPGILNDPMKGTIITFGRFLVSLERALGREISETMTRFFWVDVLGENDGSICRSHRHNDISFRTEIHVKADDNLSSERQFRIRSLDQSNVRISHLSKTFQRSREKNDL